MGAMASPVLGPAGNAEYLLWARTGPPLDLAPHPRGVAPSTSPPLSTPPWPPHPMPSLLVSPGPRRRHRP
jgi:hypothetical protein